MQLSSHVIPNKMPATIKKKANGRYTVSTPNGVHARNTTLANAVAQRNLLNAVDHGWKPTGKSSKSKAKKVTRYA